MRRVVELLDVQCIVLRGELQTEAGVEYIEFDNGTFVIVNITIIRSGEDGNDYWEFACAIPSVHFVAFDLGFMSTNDGQKSILFQEQICGIRPEEVRATANIIAAETRFAYAIIIVHRI
jgi:hypothetical protein